MTENPCCVVEGAETTRRLVASLATEGESMANEHPMRDFSCKLCTVFFFPASERPVQEITRLYCTLLLLLVVFFFVFVFLRDPSVLRE